MKNKRSLKSRAGQIILISTLAVSTVIGCAWSMLTEHSVRFNSMRTGRGFYRLPPLPIEYDPTTGRERSTIEVEQYIDENPEYENPTESEDQHPGNLWSEAEDAIENKNIDFATELFTKALDESQYKRYWDEGVEQEWSVQSQRNAAVDILDALAERRRGASAEDVLAYARARLTGHHALTQPSSPTLADNWSYLQAATLYNTGKKDEALAAFEEHDRAFPRSEKNEATMYMLGKLIMERGDVLTKDCSGEACNVEEWELSINQFKRLVTKYPNGRYALDARGWLGHLYRHQGKTGESLAEYYRLLGNRTNRQWRLDAKKSLQLLGHEYDDATLDKVETLIADEPDAALAYAYHRIYNHAVDLSYTEFNKWCCYDENSKWSQEREERARVEKALSSGQHELERVAKFSAAMVRRYGSNRVSGDFLLRIAQAQLELQNSGDALAFAEKAIASGVVGDSKAQALWVKGSSDHQLKNLAAAKSTFSKLIGEFPEHKLTEGARRLLAMTAEDMGDLEGALDIYFDLGYKQDIAYFVDVLFPTDRFANYVSKRTGSKNYDKLLYSLAVRYMREGRWNEARNSLEKVRTVSGRDDYLESEKDATWYFPKEPGYGEDIDYIKTSWVMQDLKTIDIVEYREKELLAAQGDQARAEAMYQLASTYFELDDLAFYNPAMWNGGRVSSLNELQFSAHERLSNETRTIFDHLQLHDPWAKAIPMYEEIVAKYPDSKAARDALYTIAVAHEKLERRNSVWSEIYSRGLFAGPRMVTYGDVTNIFPDYQLPRGTDRWKPSTRTVNGGPGWAPKPKPLPKLTTEQRVIRKAEKWVDKYGATVWEKAVAVKDGIRDAAAYVSGGIAEYLQNYYYLVYTGFLGAIFWANRKEIYEGPVIKGSHLAHQGLVFVAGYVRDWWVAIAVPSVIRIKPDEPSPPEPAVEVGSARA